MKRNETKDPAYFNRLRTAQTMVAIDKIIYDACFDRDISQTSYDAIIAGGKDRVINIRRQAENERLVAEMNAMNRRDISKIQV